MELTSDERAELRALINSGEVSAAVGTRARIVLWHAEGRLKKDIAVLAGVSRPTVDLWLGRGTPPTARPGCLKVLSRPALVALLRQLATIA